MTGNLADGGLEIKMFKHLNIDRKKLTEIIRQFCLEELGLELQPEVKNKSGNLYRCSIPVNEGSMLLDFYFNSDGTTTINPKVGKKTDLSLQLALYIKNKLCTSEVKNSSYSVRNVEKEAVDLLIEYLSELQGIKLNEDRSKDYTLYRYIGPDGDKIVIKYYRNGTLQVQGKPLYLYQEAVCFLAQYYTLGEIVEQQSEFFNIELDERDIQEDIDSFLPTSKTFLGKQLLGILTPSLVYNKIDVTLTDYSSFVFPVLRALEGYIKKLFQQVGIRVGKEFKQFNCVDGVYELKPEYRRRCNSGERFAIEEAYNYWRANRHSLFHTPQKEEAIRILETKADADHIIFETLKLIEKTYRKFSGVK